MDAGNQDYCAARWVAGCAATCAVVVLMIAGCTRSRDEQPTTKMAGDTGTSGRPEILLGEYSLWPSKPDVHDVELSSTKKRARVAIIRSTGSPSRFADDEWPTLIAAYWDNGTAVWSADRLEGGPPYSEGNVPPDRVDALARQLLRRAIDSHLCNWPPVVYCGPDYPATRIVIRVDDAHVFELASWHELPEQSGRVFDGRRWVRLQEGQSYRDVIPTSDRYWVFRQLWDATRKDIEATIPMQSIPTTRNVFRMLDCFGRKAE